MIKVSLRSLLFGAAVSVGLLATAGAANAIDFNVGAINAKIDTTMSLGTGIRTSAQDCSKVGVANGGCTSGDNVALSTGVRGYDFGVTSDNANILNKQWNPYTTVAKVVSELQMTYENFGAFVRAKAYYDYWGQEELGEHSQGVREPIDYNTGNARDINRQGYGAKFLDAFIYGKFDMGSTSLNVRLGNQVVNWGESLFIQGGINSFQPIDVGAIVKPGSELKEAYEPDPMLYAQLTLPANLGFEAFYKFGWNKSTLPVAGSFFGGYASADGIGPGMPYLPFGVDYAQSTALTGSESAAVAAGLLVRRFEDRDPSSQGQFGAKVGYYADWLNDGTDMGLYFTHYHSNLPYLTFSVASPDLAYVGGPAGQYTIRQFCTAVGLATFATCAGTDVSPGVSGLKAALLSSATHLRYGTSYAPGISSIGFSFNTVLANILNGTALSGEANFTPNMPFQRDVYTGMLANNLQLAQAAQFAAGVPDGTPLPFNLIADGGSLNGVDGSIITPWAKYQSLTGQLGTVSTLPSTNPIAALTGSDLVILVGNVGFQYIPDLKDNSYLSGSHSTFNSINALTDLILGQGKCPGNPTGTGNPSQSCPGANNYYANSFSWGYRLTMAAQYNNAFGTAWTMTPSIAWSHDVSGISAGPQGPGFVEGIKKVSIGVGASYQGTWRVNVDWTSAFGNKFLNDNIDKDYASATVSYAF